VAIGETTRSEEAIRRIDDHFSHGSAAAFQGLVAPDCEQYVLFTKPYMQSVGTASASVPV